MPKCYLGKLNDSTLPSSKYFNDDDDANRSNKVVLLIGEKGIGKKNEDVRSVGVECPTNKNKCDDDSDNIYDDYILSDKKKVWICQ